MTSTTTDRRFGVNAGMAVKIPCRAATTANITLSGEQTIDGVACVTGDRVLVKNQTSGVNNGIYLVDTGTWTRVPDMNGSFDVVKGSFLYVTDGSTLGGTWWGVSTSSPVIGTSSLTFTATLLGDSSTLSFTQAGTGAVTRTGQAKLREIEISTEDYDNGESDYSLVIMKAFAYAETLLPAKSTQPSGAEGYSYGSIRVKLPAGAAVYACATQIVIPPMVNFEGDGSGNSVLVFSHDGVCIRNKTSADGAAYPYQWERGRIAHMRIRGDRTKTSQVLLSLLRFNFCPLEDVEVENSGSDNIVLTECLAPRLSRIRSTGSKGKGLKLAASAGPLPCIKAKLTDCIFSENDAEGIHFDGANGTVIVGGSCDENFAASVFSSIGTSETATMRQVRISGVCHGNVFYGTHFEGEANAHIYVETAVNSTQFNAAVNCSFIPKGTAGNVDRAVVVNQGAFLVVDPEWQADLFRTINSSNAPIRIGKANGGRVYLRAVLQTGTSQDAELMVEDKDGFDGNLASLAVQDIITGAEHRLYAQHKVYGEHGQVSFDFFRTGSASSTNWDEHPFLRVSTTDRGLNFGSGLASPDTNLYWSAANTLKTDDCVALADAGTFASTDATPSVAGKNNWITANASGTVITAFDDGVEGQVINVVINDANTTIDFTGTTLKGNAGADWMPTTNDHMTCVKIGANWYCRISDNTA